MTTMRTQNRTWVDGIPRCGHGERTDRFTKKGEPICPFCRRQKDPWAPQQLDVAALAANDTTQEES